MQMHGSKSEKFAIIVHIVLKNSLKKCKNVLLCSTELQMKVPQIITMIVTFLLQLFTLISQLTNTVC